MAAGGSYLTDRPRRAASRRPTVGALYGCPFRKLDAIAVLTSGIQLQAGDQRFFVRSAC
jgi:hypothetical protein